MFGNGAKAGGPNYVAGLGSWTPKNELDPTAAGKSYRTWWKTTFSQEHDPSGLTGESNHFRYVPIKRLGVLAAPDTPQVELELVQTAAAVAGISLIVVYSPEEMIAQLPNIERVRALSQPSEQLLRAAQDQHVPLIQEPLSADGRLELRYYLRGQAISETQHRYGNLVEKIG